MELFLQLLLDPGTQDIWFPGRDPRLGKKAFLDQKLDPAVRFQVCESRESGRERGRDTMNKSIMKKRMRDVLGTGTAVSGGLL